MALSDNLLLYLPLNEASGNALDAHSGGIDYTDNGTVAATTGLVYGNARDFTPANGEYFSRADSAPISMGDIDFFICAWVYLDTEGSGNKVIACHADYGNNQRSWTIDYLQSSDRFRFYVSSNGESGGAQTVVTANNYGAVPTGTWLLVMAWHDASGNTINISVNNGTADSAAHTTGVHNSTATLLIGCSQNNGTADVAAAGWDGRIGPLAIWRTRIPSSGERASIYNSGAGLTYAALIGGSSFKSAWARGCNQLIGVS
jgi:hypothetical protein